MTAAAAGGGRGGRWIEAAFAGLVILFVLVAGWHLHRHGYLPQPFLADPRETYMDGVNTAYWSHAGGTYDLWQSIYPPLSFLYLRLVSLPGCYLADPYGARACDWRVLASMDLCYLLNAVIIFKSYRRSDRGSSVPRTIAMTLGLPMLFALERANMVIPCFAAFALAHGPLLRSARARWLCAALAINLKPYVLMAAVVPLLRRRWRWSEGALLATLIVYLASWALKGDGSPLEIVDNIRHFTGDPDRMASWSYIVYATSYASLINFMTSDFPLVALVGSGPVAAATLLLGGLVHLAQLTMLAAFVAVWRVPACVAPTRLAALAMLFVLCTTDPGGYAQIFALYLVFFERWRGPARITALVAGYLLCLATDISLAPLPAWSVDSYLGGGAVVTHYGLTVGPLLRPGLLILIAIALASATLADAVRMARRARAADPASPPENLGVAPLRV